MVAGKNQGLKGIAALDLEIHPETDALLAVGAVFEGKNLNLPIDDDREPVDALKKLDKFCNGASWVLGHGIVNHDLPWLQRNAPWMKIHETPAIDTLFLAPLAFPTHPYHKLYKGYKPVPSSKNDPLRDSRQALEFFEEECRILSGHPFLPVLPYFLSEKEDYAGCGRSLVNLFGIPVPEKSGILRIFAENLRGKICERILSRFEKFMREPRGGALIQAVFWLLTADERSRLAPWVVHSFPETVIFLKKVREQEICRTCVHCREYNDLSEALKRFFGFDSFRMVSDAPPVTQKDVAEAIVREEDLLVILSTGGGKSLCYQLPARMLARRRNLLTLIISPLQSLMKDQVDSLKGRGILDAGAINGMQTALERIEMIDGVLMGTINVLFAAPEQMRNENFCRVLKQRELGLVVIDEAHCLSKWGHDFRPDYLYICKFLRSVVGETGTFPTVACFTATAKRDVIEEITQYFRAEAGKSLRVIQGGLDRPNLHFFVTVIEVSQKRERILEILRASMGDGAAIIFTSTRKKSEEISEFLYREGFRADFFHAGLPPEKKREVQDRFLKNQLHVITATNAFGMGVDKPDIRVVIHTDVPGSLENYLQEAGRAGRDGQDAECHLLFCQADLEEQFSLTSRSRITYADLAGIFRGVKHLALTKPRRTSKNQDPPAKNSPPMTISGSSAPPTHMVVKTTGEILRGEFTETDSFDETDEMADTKVKIALSWLEKVKCLERTWNRTSVIQAKPLFSTLDECLARMRALGLSGRTRKEWAQLLNFLFQAQNDAMYNTDILSDLFGREGEEIQKTFRELKMAKIIECDLLFTAFINIQPGNIKDSRARWDRTKRLEAGLRDLLNEEGEPGDDNGLTLHFRGIATLLKERANTPDAIQDDIRIILQGWQNDGTVSFRSQGYELFHLQYHRTRQEVNAASQQRLSAAECVFRHLKSITKGKGMNIRINFSQKDLETVLAQTGQADQEKIAKLVKKGLLTLHESRVISLQNGMAFFRPALSLKLQSSDLPKAKDCEDLGRYFDGKTAQIHVMGKYAEYGQKEITDAQRMVKDYFNLDHNAFSSKYFHGEKWKLDIPTGEESLNRIIGNTSASNLIFTLSDKQRAIVQESPACNIMILAGPGSGKTKTLVHRAAWLMRVKRVPWGSVLVVAFNRSTVLEIRHRLKSLIGRDARHVQVQTYHGLALRISGRSLAYSDASKKTADFEKVIGNVVKEANSILENLRGRDRDEMTGGLIGKLRYLLVDEYQDVNEDQYHMISLLARKDEPEAAHRVHVLAVGDDDQNIYTWNGADVKFLRQFTKDYEAATHHLLTNYRSSPTIVDRTASFIGKNPLRMKHDTKMVSSRKGKLAGNREELKFVSGVKPAESLPAIVSEIGRLMSCGFLPHEIAVLTRFNDDVVKVRFLAEEAGFPSVILRKPQISVLRLREIRNFLNLLKNAGREETPVEMVAEIIQGFRRDFTSSENPWERLIDSVIEQYFEETSHPSVKDFFHFFMDSIREFRQGEARREGFISIATMHAAKGLEFPAVIVLMDGLHPSEEERRLAYVAMTRAKESLVVVSGAPLVGLAGEVADSSEWGTSTGNVTLGAAAVQVLELGPKDIHLSWPAMHAGRQIIETISGIEVGSKGELIETKDGFRILFKGVPIVKSSKAGAQRLRDFHGMKCADVSCYAILTRNKSDEDPEFAQLIHHEEWEYPLFQLIFSTFRR